MVTNPTTTPTTPTTDANGNPVTTPTTPTTSSTTGTFVPLSNLGRLSTADFSTTIPGATLQLVLSDANTKVLQSPQLRAVDNVKATLKIGDRQPTATGSFQPGIGGVGINPLVNTQFTFIDVGVNVEITPRVHDNGDVSLHIDLDISSVTGHVNLGGIDQPIIGQRKISHDIRMPEGAVQLLGGLTKYQETKTKTGVPGLMGVPILGKLFSGDSVDRQRQELMIALIPHIVRRPEYTAENLRGIAVGNQQSVHLSYGRQAGATPPAAPKNEPAARRSRRCARRRLNPPIAAVNPADSATRQRSAGRPLPDCFRRLRRRPQPLRRHGAAACRTGQACGHKARGQCGRPFPARAGGNHAARHHDRRPHHRERDGCFVRAPASHVRSQSGQAERRRPRRFLLQRRPDSASSPRTFRTMPGAAAMNLNRLPNTPGVTGSGVLTTLVFQGVAKGSTTVTVPNLTVRNSQGQVVFSGSPQVTINVK